MGDFELIAVDDGSDDDTADRFLEIADDRCLLLKGTGEGIARALTVAAGRARGHYLARMDGDDLCHPSRFGRQAALLGAEPEAAAVGSGFEVIDEHGAVLRHQPVPLDDLMARALLVSHNPFCHGAMMMRRAAWSAAGGYHSEDEPAEDYALWLRLASVGRFAAVPDALYLHRAHGGQVSNAQAGAQHAAAFRWAAAARAGLPIPQISAEALSASAGRHRTAGEASLRLFVRAAQELSVELRRRGRRSEAESIVRMLTSESLPGGSLRHKARLAKATLRSVWRRPAERS
jgi:glycosyltransferase involved in cell wall biosynthesis